MAIYLKPLAFSVICFLLVSCVTSEQDQGMPPYPNGAVGPPNNQFMSGGGPPMQQQMQMGGMQMPQQGGRGGPQMGAGQSPPQQDFPWFPGPASGMENVEKFIETVKNTHCANVEVTYVSAEGDGLKKALESSPHDPSVIIQQSQTLPEWVVSAAQSPSNLQVDPHETPISIFKVSSFQQLDKYKVETNAQVATVSARVRKSDGVEFQHRHQDSARDQYLSNRDTFDLEVQYQRCHTVGATRVKVSLQFSGCPMMEFGYQLTCSRNQEGAPVAKGLSISTHGTTHMNPDVVANGMAVGVWGDLTSNTLVDVPRHKDKSTFYIYCKECSSPVYFQKVAVSGDLEVVWPTAVLPHWSTPEQMHIQWFAVDPKPQPLEIHFHCHAEGNSVVVVNVELPFFRDVQFVVRKHCPPARGMGVRSFGWSGGSIIFFPLWLVWQLISFWVRWGTLLGICFVAGFCFFQCVTRSGMLRDGAKGTFQSFGQAAGGKGGDFVGRVRSGVGGAVNAAARTFNLNRGERREEYRNEFVFADEDETTGTGGGTVTITSPPPSGSRFPGPGGRSGYEAI